ncbi:YqhR family membrane protein [Shouchella sp. JSM 1781072]|uniref:YqhR family membrane protein n=1 Tax=Bacillaceae TaxID=186817 RepID=UPI0020D0A3E9|nr:MULTISPECIES: YqhR family membrane protein [Bacillaceae]UTR04966.1 YqhR family membrane protein [Alkalihalobacillus sp. LMS6]
MNKTDKEIMDTKQMGFPMKVVLIGFFGGLIWSFVGYACYYFHLTEVGPSFVLLPWALGDWKIGHTGQVVGMAVIAVLSIGIAFLYKVLLQKVNSMWPGVGFGVVLWVILFYILNPFIVDLDPVQSYSLNTIVTTLCLFIIYGLFIGYSISYEYAEQKSSMTQGESV